MGVIRAPLLRYVREFSEVGCCLVMANTSIARQPFWLNKKRMAESLGISVQAFDKWGVEAIAKVGRESFYDVRSILDNRLKHQGVKHQPAGPDGETIDPFIEYRLLQERLRLTAGQATAQERKNLVTEKELVPVDFMVFAELFNTCLTDMECSVENAREQLLVALGKDTTPTGGPAPRHPGHLTNGNLVGDSVRASLVSRTGQGEIQKDNAYNYMSLRELARASLQDRGILVATLAPMQMVGMAFTHDTSDFGNILVDIAAASVLQGWNEAEETFHLWTKTGRLSDFKTAKRVGMGEFPTLREVRPGAEYKYITTGDRGETIRLATYGELFSITRQAILNDDLDQLTTIPKRMGEAARGTIGDLVYDTLINNQNLSDDKKLFADSRKNLFTGAGSALSIESLSKAKTAMALQKNQTEGGKARTLNIRPGFVLVPVALEDKAKQLIRSASVPGAETNAGIDNPIRNFAEVIAEPRLDDNSSTAWYLAAKKGSDTIEVAYLDGVELPYLEQQQGFTNDGVISKVRIDAGVAPLDSRGLNKSNGA